mmetsp:Transcript_84510/g.176824  ORF Transcript_84510/g.176824 Transcript_84510/m.176824 type:complete len:185 (-) Transcript_84510:294-848(-)
MVVDRVANSVAHKVWQDCCQKERGQQLGGNYGVPWAARAPLDRLPEVSGFGSQRVTGGHSFAPRPTSQGGPKAEYTEQDFPARSAWFPRGVPNPQNNISYGASASLGTLSSGGWQRSGGIRTVYNSAFSESKRPGEGLFDYMQREYEMIQRSGNKSSSGLNRSLSTPFLERGGLRQSALQICAG